MKLLNFTIIKLTLCLVIGIILGHYFRFDFHLSTLLSIGLIISSSVYWCFLRGKIIDSTFFAILGYASMTSLGINAYNIQNERLDTNHYTNFQIESNLNDIVFKIEERLKPDLYNDKYIGQIQSINNSAANGRILINIKRDSIASHLPIDAVLLAKSEFKAIQKPLNPHQFDYSEYLELKQVYKQIYLEKSETLLLSKEKTSIYGFADALRQNINQKLKQAGFKVEVLSIINALLLGQRQSIDKSIYNNYVNSGTIHILAVSGLHVGILLLILNYLFSPLLYLKHGRILRPLIIIILLWAFAIVAGLSPSVTRAVTMFSIISFAMHLKRPTNIYNTLAISAFFILLVKPMFLFEVGFQLSYLAVLGIVSIQPIIYRIWNPKFLLTDKLWQVFTVTIAAQIGVLPISLFYFHQFPGLFFISNLVIIPFLGIILGLGLLIILLSLLNILPEFAVNIYSYIIENLNNFIAWIAQFEDFLFRDIPFTFLQVICTYWFIISKVQLYRSKNYKWIIACLIGIIGFQSTLFINKYNSKHEAFIVFNKSRHSIIGQKQSNQLTIHHNLDASKLKTENTVKNYSVGEMIDTISFDKLKSIYKFKDKTILVIDSLGVYKDITFNPDYILLRESPKINLNRLIDKKEPKLIIADASNYKSYVKRWKLTCDNKKIPFHYTNEKGAFILK